MVSVPGSHGNKWMIRAAIPRSRLQGGGIPSSRLGKLEVPATLPTEVFKRLRIM